MADLDAYVNSYLVYPATVTELWNTERTALDAGGLGIRRRKWQNPLYRFDLEVRFFDSSPMSSFMSFYNGKSGAATSFTWAPPSDVASGTYTCIFDEDRFQKVLAGPNYFRVSFSLLATL